MIFAPGVRAMALRAAVLASMSAFDRLLYRVDQELQRAARIRQLADGRYVRVL